MQRVKIEIPQRILYSFPFTITQADINIAEHMGNERILVFANTVRENFFAYFKLNYVDVENKVGIIVANHTINYKSEGFLGDEIVCEVGVDTITECSFDLIFHFIKNQERSLAVLRTGCVYFNFKERKINALPDSYLQVFEKK